MIVLYNYLATHSSASGHWTQPPRAKIHQSQEQGQGVCMRAFCLLRVSREGFTLYYRYPLQTRSDWWPVPLAHLHTPVAGHNCFFHQLSRIFFSVFFRFFRFFFFFSGFQTYANRNAKSKSFLSKLLPSKRSRKYPRNAAVGKKLFDDIFRFF